MLRTSGALAHQMAGLFADGRGLLDGKADAVDALPLTERELLPSTYLVREGQRPTTCGVLTAGYLFQQKLMLDGSRSIVALLVPGDFVDLQNLFIEESDHDLVALTRATLSECSIADMRQIALDHRAIGEMLWRESLVQCSISREWMANIARRDARTRTAHLLCEFSARLVAAGLAQADAYELPMTQEQLGDALGLTSVHVNRVLRGLEHDKLIERRKREMRISDLNALRRAAEFNPRYLHQNG